MPERMSEFDNNFNTADFTRISKNQSYDIFMNTLAQNIDNLTKNEILNIFQSFITDLKGMDKEMMDAMYKTQNEELVDTYSHVTRSHVASVNETIKEITKPVQKEETVQNPNVLPSDILK